MSKPTDRIGASSIRRHMPAAMRHVEHALCRAGVNVDIIDAVYTVRYVDPAWRKRYRDPVGKKCYRVFEGRSTVCPGCGIPRALRTRRVVAYESTLGMEGGRPIHVVTVPFRDEQGDWLVAEVNIDVAERKKAEDAIRISEARFRAIAESARDFIYTIDRNHVVSYVNDFAAVSLRKKPRQIIGRKLDTLFGRCDYMRMCKAIDRVFARGRSIEAEDEFAFVRGGIWLSTRLCPIKDERGRTMLVLGISRDITPLKRAEVVLRRDKAALARLVRDRTAALLEAQKKLDQSERLVEIGTLAASVAHELRNPLAAIRTAVFNIRRKTSDLSLESHMTNIERKIQESDQIINNLLSYSRIRMPDFSIVNLCLLMDECIDAARQRYAGYSVTVRKEYQGTCVACVDPVQIKEVFNNILNNAYEAMPEKRGGLLIRIYECGKEWLCVSIADTGTGISQENMRRLYQPFFSTKKIGTGLGLPICHKIIQLHNGTILTKSAVGEGTTVMVRVPITKKLVEKSQ